MIALAYILLIVLSLNGLFLGVYISPLYFAAPAVCLIIFISSLVIISRRRKNVPSVQGWQLGEAIDLSRSDRRKVNNAVITKQAVNLGILALGGPGSGKTESIALALFYSFPEALPGSGLAFFEGKGDIDIYKKACASGRKPDKFFSTELPGSDTLNLMEGELLDVEDRLSRLLIGETASTSFYSDLQRSILKFAIPILKGFGEAVSLRDLYVLLSHPSAQSEVLIHARESDIDQTVVSMYEQWLMTDFDDRKKEISGLLNRLAEYCLGEINDRINDYEPTISVADVVKQNQFIYFHLPLSEYTRNVAIAIVEMFGVEARRRQLSGPEQYKMFPLLMDDWGAFFHDNFGPFSARCRSALMPLIFSFQSLAQIKCVSDNFARELDDNLATKIILRINGEDTAQFAINLLGKEKTLQVNTSLMGDRDGTSLGLSDSDLITPRDLRELKPGECFVSTILRVGDDTKNPLWRLRIPRAPYKESDVETTTMPEPVTKPKGRGLNLWDKYMNPKSLSDYTDSPEDSPEDNEFEVAEL